MKQVDGEDEEPPTRRCSVCTIEQPLDGEHFYRVGRSRRTGRVWYRGTCKVCCDRAGRARKQMNLRRVRQLDRERRRLARARQRRKNRTTRLSPLQRGILLRIAQQSVAADRALRSRMVESTARAVSWQPRGEASSWSAAASASVSRSLRRLEQRGLVVRGGRAGRSRTIQVMLTVGGWQAISSLFR